MTEKQKTPIQKAINIIDAEYDMVSPMGKDDLWDYLSGFEEMTELTRKQSDEIHDYYL